MYVNHSEAPSLELSPQTLDSPVWVWDIFVTVWYPSLLGICPLYHVSHFPLSILFKKTPFNFLHASARRPRRATKEGKTVWVPGNALPSEIITFVFRTYIWTLTFVLCKLVCFTVRAGFYRVTSGLLLLRCCLSSNFPVTLADVSSPSSAISQRPFHPPGKRCRSKSKEKCTQGPILHFHIPYFTLSYLLKLY